MVSRESQLNLGPDVRQRRAVGYVLDLPLAPEHNRRQQHADAPDQEPAKRACVTEALFVRQNR